MKNRIIHHFFYTILFTQFSLACAVAQGFRTASLTGNVSSDFTAAERVSTGGGITYAMTWDANNLYFGVGGGGSYIKDQPSIMYLDTDPVVNPLLGTGSVTGFNSYDGRSGSAPFSSNFVLYLKSSYAEFRTSASAGVWSGQTNVSPAIVTGANDIEITIPWTSFPGGVRPASLRSIFFKENGGGGNDAYGIMPGDSYNANIGGTQTITAQYYTSWNTNSGVMNNTLVANCTPPQLVDNTPLILNFNDYKGAGFSNNPLASVGQLCNNSWAVTGFSDGAKTFGSVAAYIATGDHARGLTTGGVTTGGLYGLDRTGGNYAVWIQPGSGNFNPGKLTLKVQNTTGAALTGINISYDVLEYNDKPGSSTFNCWVSADDVTYTQVTALNYLTATTAAAAPTVVSTPKTGTHSAGFSVANNGFFYVQFRSQDDVAVSGQQRDEFGFDNLKIQACGITSVAATAPACSCGKANFAVSFTAYAPNSGNFNVINTATNAILASGTTSPINVSVLSGAASSISVAVVDAADATCQSSSVSVALPNCAAIAPMVTATAVASIVGTAVGQYNIVVSNINGGDCSPYNVTINGVTQVYTAAPLTFGPFNNKSIGGPGFYAVSIDDADADATADLILEVAEAYSTGILAQQNTTFCDCALNPPVPPTAPTNGPAGVIMVQSQPGSFQANGTSGKLQVYLAVSGGNIVSSNSTGLHVGLANGSYQVYALNYLVADAAIIAPLIVVGQPIAALKTPTGAVANACFNLSAAATYAVNCTSVPVMMDLTPSICTGVNGNLTSFEAQLGGAGGVWTDATGAVVATPGSVVVNGTTNPFKYKLNGTNSCYNTAKVTYVVDCATTLICTDFLNVGLSSPTACDVILEPKNILTGNLASSPLGFTIAILNGTSMYGTAGATVKVTDKKINNVNINGGTFGKTYTIKVSDASGNSCWGQVKFEDKKAPVLSFTTKELTLSCDESFPAGPSYDDCSSVTTKTNEEIETKDCSSVALAVGGFYETKVITRTYIFTDKYGNESTATQKVHFQRPVWNPLAPPTLTITDKSLPCSASYPSKGAGGTPTLKFGTTTINVSQTCDLMDTYSDVVVPTCGAGYKVIRTWTVLDWCTNLMVSATQIIKVEDTEAPEVICDPTEIVISTDPDYCGVKTYTIPMPTGKDNCDKDVTITASLRNPAGVITQSGFTVKNLVIGTYTIEYFATDNCGNKNLVACSRSLKVVDNVEPVAVCDQNTKISLTIDGTAVVNATSFNDGSRDNCCLDPNRFEIKRPSDANFAPTIKFGCADKNSTVILRVWDCYNNSNTCEVNVKIDDKIKPVIFAKNLTMKCGNNPSAQALLDNNKPQLLSLNNFPTATNPGYYDGCLSKDPTFTDSPNINNCGIGTYTRTWVITDDAGNSASTVQTVTSSGRSAYRVTFPADATLSCTDKKTYETDPSKTGEPKIVNLGNPGDPTSTTCPVVSIEHEDEEFSAVPQACYKILRKWKIMNFCQLTSNTSVQKLELIKGAGDEYKPYSPACNLGTVPRTYTNISPETVFDPDYAALLSNNACHSFDQDGYMEFVQVIYINDEKAPQFTDVPDVSVTDAPNCSVRLSIPKPNASDCSTDLVYTYQVLNKTSNAVVSFGNLSNTVDLTFGKSDFGDYIVRFTASDKCGNYSSTDRTVTIKDAKKPTPVCFQGLSAALMPTTGMATISATQFDAGSYDNCTSHANLKFYIESSNNTNPTTVVPTTTSLNFNCKGIKLVRLWAVDEAGNADYCDTYVDLQYPWEGAPGAVGVDLCPPLGNAVEQYTIAGAVATESGQLLSADLKIQGTITLPPSVKWTSVGAFNFGGLEKGKDYTVVPQYDQNPNNGVSTFDLVLMSKHILNIQPITSPYKIIAADINKSKTITTFDMVELRKLILKINDKFTNNTSWRFVDKNFTFADPTKPFAAAFPETKTITNLSGNVTDADFVAIKVGDINGNAITQGQPNENNKTSNFVLTTDNKAVKAGETLRMMFKGRDMEQILGYQFTFEYDQNSLELQQIEGATENFAVLENGIITASWNGEKTSDDQLFGFTFKAKTTVTPSEVVHLSSKYTKTEAYSDKGQQLGVNLEFTTNNAPSTTHSFELFQNQPNPTRGATTISFQLPTASSAKITISDAAGKLIKVIEGDYKAGYNEVFIDNISNIGVLQYRLDTATHSATKKMIVIE